jgi:hypothetical protein
MKPMKGFTPVEQEETGEGRAFGLIDKKYPDQ